ncbi:MAG: hypothetical protein M3Z46_12735 [Actinomycetota bacterium]|nr:hypothetical protein [Actinomycetota bacterium]
MSNTDGAARVRRYRGRHLVALSILVAALGLGGAACGKSSSSSKGTSPAGKTTNATALTKTPEVSPAGDIPDNQAYVVYAPSGQGYSVKVPEGWARTVKGGVTVFTDKLNSIRVEPASHPNAPTVASVTSLELPKLAHSENRYVPGRVSAVRRTAGSAVLVTYEADGPPDAVTAKVPHLAVERYEFWRNGRSVVLTLAGVKGADNVDPWKLVTNSFGWKP